MEVRTFDLPRADPSPRPQPPVSLLLGPNLLAATQEELRARSGRRREALVVWAGRQAPTDAP